MFQSALETQMEVAEAALQRAVDGFDPDGIPASEAVRVHARLERMVRTASAARTLLARRVADSMEWKRQGYASAAEQLAATSGRSLGAARTELETSEALAGLPRTRDGMLTGALSPDQGAVIAGAAAASPEAEVALIDTAKTANLHELRHEALKAKAAADRDPAATHARIRRERRIVRFTDGEGARHLNIRGPVDEVAVIEAELDRRVGHLIRSSPPAQPLAGRDAMAFDAAVAMARRSEGADDAPAPTGGRRRPARPRPQHLALLRLDVEALWRGHVEGDELCEVTGLGPIPVEVARRLLGDAVLKLVITKGEAVAQVTSLTRGATAAMTYALLWTSPTCTVEGCSRTIVEHDHRWGSEYKDTRHTRLDELDPVCHPHHALHTRHGWALVVGTGKRAMVPPDDPAHPAHQPRSAAPPRPERPPPCSGGGGPPTTFSRSNGQAALFGGPAA